MRIAIWHNLPFGGGSRALLDQVRGLLARGHDLEVWSPPTADRASFPLRDLAREHVVAHPNPRPGSTFPRRPWARARRTGKELAAAGIHAKWCAEGIDSAKFDVVLANTCQYYNAPPIGSVLRTPSVLYLQEPSRELHQANPHLPWQAYPARSGPWWQPSYVSGFLRDLVRTQDLRLRLRAEGDSARAYDRLLVNSLFTREAVLRGYGVDAHVCYLGVDTTLFRPLGLKTENVVITVGGYLGRHKDIGLMIDALSLVPPPRPRLVCISQLSDVAYVSELRAQASLLGVDLDVRLNISEDALVVLLSTAKCALYGGHLEPFGYGPLEAGACGIPVIAVAEGGLRETVDHERTGFLVPRSPNAMADTLIRLLSDDSLSRYLGRNGRHAVEAHWSTTSATERLESHLLITSAVGKATGQPRQPSPTPPLGQGSPERSTARATFDV